MMVEKAVRRMHGWKLVAAEYPIAAAIAVYIVVVRLAVRLLTRFGVVKPEKENKVFGDVLAAGVIAIIVALIVIDEYWI